MGFLNYMNVNKNTQLFLALKLSPKKFLKLRLKEADAGTLVCSTVMKLKVNFHLTKSYALKNYKGKTTVNLQGMREKVTCLLMLFQNKTSLNDPHPTGNFFYKQPSQPLKCCRIHKKLVIGKGMNRILILSNWGEDLENNCLKKVVVHHVIFVHFTRYYFLLNQTRVSFFVYSPTAPQDSLDPTSKKPLPPPSKLLRCLNIRYQELYFSS